MDKQSLRTQMMGLGSTDPEMASRTASHLRFWLAARLPGTVTAYLAMSHEVDLSDLFEALPGWNWVLPRVEEDGRLTFRDRAIPRELHPYGMSQPVDMGTITPLHLIDVLLVPGLAFDELGGRLGHGGGFYDRVLTKSRGDSVSVGVTTTSRVVASVPTDEHDQRVDFLATEDGVMKCRPKR